MANLHFHYGTMGASKSAALIINAFNFRKNGVGVEVIKPAFDKRDSETKIVSRLNIETNALALQNLSRFNPSPETKVILVDEVQFFKPSDIDKLVKIADNKNIIVMCYGLMVDSNQNIFPASKRLIEVAAQLHELESNCQINECLRPATHHLRFDKDNKVIRNGKQLILGDTCFKSVCRQHYNEFYHGKIK